MKNASNIAHIHGRGVDPEAGMFLALHKLNVGVGAVWGRFAVESQSRQVKEAEHADHTSLFHGLRALLFLMR